MISCNSQKKKEFLFSNVYFAQGNFLKRLYFISMYGERWINFRKTYLFTNDITSYRSYKKQKDSLEGSLDRALLAAELKFPKILVRRLPLHTSNVNNEFTGRSKQRYSLCDQPLGAPIYLYVNALIPILIC